jgi:hypothetical protein
MKSYLLLPICLLALCLLGCDGDAAKLRDHGVTTSASIRGKNETAGSSRGSRYRSFDLMYMARDSAQIAAAARSKDAFKDTTKSMAERIENWDPSGGGFGKMTSVTIDVDGATFEKYNAGQSVEIVYLPEDHQVVRLKEHL